MVPCVWFRTLYFRVGSRYRCVASCATTGVVWAYVSFVNRRFAFIFVGRVRSPHTSISRRLHQSSRARPHALARRAAGPGKGHSIDSSFPIAHRSGVDRGACACARARARAHVRLRVPTPSASRPRRPRRARRRASLLAPHACRCSRRAPPVRGRRSELRPRTPSRAARLLSPVNTSSRHDGDTGWHTAHDKTASMHKIAWRAP